MRPPDMRPDTINIFSQMQSVYIFTRTANIKSSQEFEIVLYINKQPL